MNGERLDLDRWQETAWAVVGAVLYLAGVVAAAYGFAVWLGVWAAGVVLLVAGGVPSAYSLLRASSRLAERERAEREARHRAQLDVDRAGPRIAVRP